MPRADRGLIKRHDCARVHPRILFLLRSSRRSPRRHYRGIGCSETIARADANNRLTLGRRCRVSRFFATRKIIALALCAYYFSAHKAPTNRNTRAWVRGCVGAWRSVTGLRGAAAGGGGGLA